MICDVHAHYTPKNFSQLMGDRFASPTHLPVKRRTGSPCRECGQPWPCPVFALAWPADDSDV